MVAGMSKVISFSLGVLIGGGAIGFLLGTGREFPELSQPWATIISSAIALIAACIAYLAATQKVRSDNAQDERNRAERQHNLLVKLLYAVRAAERDIECFGSEISGGASAILTLEAAQKINLPREIPIIWEKAGLLPVPIADAVGEMMEVYAEIENFKNTPPEAVCSDSDKKRVRDDSRRLYFAVSNRTIAIMKKINADLNAADPNRESLQAERAQFD